MPDRLPRAEAPTLTESVKDPVGARLTIVDDPGATRTYEQERRAGKLKVLTSLTTLAR